MFGRHHPNFFTSIDKYLSFLSSIKEIVREGLAKLNPDSCLEIIQGLAMVTATKITEYQKLSNKLKEIRPLETKKKEKFEKNNRREEKKTNKKTQEKSRRKEKEDEKRKRAKDERRKKDKEEKKRREQEERKKKAKAEKRKKEEEQRKKLDQRKKKEKEERKKQQELNERRKIKEEESKKKNKRKLSQNKEQKSAKKPRFEEEITRGDIFSMIPGKLLLRLTCRLPQKKKYTVLILPLIQLQIAPSIPPQPTTSKSWRIFFINVIQNIKISIYQSITN